MPLFYRSFRQSDRATPVILARTSLDAAALLGPMQRALRELNIDLPVVTAKTMTQHLGDSLAV